jgi:transcription elongation factor Elf1/ribosomal protein L7Ae-like RNA K-turn-binding protein
MSVFIDRSFLLQVSPKLKKFAKKKDDLYNFRCPFCGDSQKDKNKSRGYIYRKKNDYFFMCHNCHASTSFYNFLKQVDSKLLESYTLERYKSTANTKPSEPTFTELKVKPVFRQKIDLPTIESLSEDHFAKQYVNSRKIPKERHSELYYCDDFKTFVHSFKVEKELKDNEKRLIIPFYDKEKNLVAFQGRALDDSKIRYITIKLEENLPKIFGIDRIDENEKIYVFEGPIDSMFIPNAIAVASSALEYASGFIDKSKLVLVFDNEPRNKEILKLIDHAIDNHFNVVIWPEMIKEKDINEMILAGFDSEELLDIIKVNTFVNLRAKMEFINWKKV